MQIRYFICIEWVWSKFWRTLRAFTPSPGPPRVSQRPCLLQNILWHKSNLLTICILHFATKPYESGITASQAKDPKSLCEYVCKDKEYRFKKNVRGSPPYYQCTFYELLAMVRQLGIPTWLFTVSAADLKWSDMIHVIARQFGKFYKTDKEIEQLPLRNAVIG